MIRPCMSEEESALWERANRERGAKVGSVCFDCTMAFHLEQRALGLCDSEPGRRPVALAPPTTERRPKGRPKIYPDGPARDALRAKWRRAQRRRTIRRRVEKSLESGLQ